MTERWSPGDHERDIHYREYYPGRFAQEVYDAAAAAVGDAVRGERFFLASSDRISVSLGGNLRATLANPAGSGVNLVVVRLVAHVASDRMAVGQVFINPDTGLPAVSYTPFNAAAGSAVAAQGAFDADSSGTALSGGTPTDLYLASHKGRNELDLLIVIPPGLTLGLNVPLGATEAGDGAFAAYWYEQPRIT